MADLKGKRIDLGAATSPRDFSPALENQYCLPVPTFCHLDHLQNYAFLARRLCGRVFMFRKEDSKLFNDWLLTFVCLLVYPFFLAGDLEFLGGGGPDTRNINSPSALAPNLHPAPMPSCHMIRCDMIRYGKMW